MKNETKTGVVTAIALAALAISGGAVFIGSGVYDIGADDHHTKLVLALIERLREHRSKLGRAVLMFKICPIPDPVFTRPSTDVSSNGRRSNISVRPPRPRSHDTTVSTSSGTHTRKSLHFTESIDEFVSYD